METLDTAKNISAKFEAFAAPGVLDDTDEAELNAAFVALDSAKADLTATLKKDDAVEAEGTLVLKEGDEDGLTHDGGAAFFRLSGTVVKAPTTAWAATDGFTATIAFTFEPSEYVTPYNTAPTATGTASNADGTVTLTLAAPKGVKVDPATVKWTTSATSTNGSIVDNSSTTTELKGTFTLKKAATKDATYTASVEFKDINGNSYKSADATINVTKPE